MKREGPRPLPSSEAASAGLSPQHSQWSAPLVVPRDPQTDVPVQESGEPAVKIGASGDRLIQLYLKEASATPLLTLDEEHRLAVLNAAGDEESRQRLIKSNLLFVVSLAKEFAGFGLDFADLIALGNIGLMRAVDRFDPNRGAKLSTYASWWIKQSIRRGLSDGAATIRVPAYRHHQVRELMKAQRALSDTLKRDPSLEELALHMGVSEEQVKDRFTAAHVRSTVPLDAPLSPDSSGGEGATLYDTISDPTVVATSDSMIRAEQYLLVRAILGDRKALKTVAETLQPLVIFYQGRFDRREIDILTKRFGLDTASGRGKTLEEIGSQYHVTRERIRQLEARALLKFKRAFEHIDNQRDRMAEALVVDGKKECASGRE